MQQVMQFGARKPALAATGLRQTLVIFGGASALLFVATHGLIPMLSRVTGQEALLCWFLVGGLGVFLPLLILAGLLLHTEGTAWGRGLWVERLRFHPMNRGDWWWSVAALLPILVIEPYVVQRRQNSWVGVLIHAAFNGPAFLAIAFGML